MEIYERIQMHRDTLMKRGLNRETIKKFGIGLFIR